MKGDFSRSTFDRRKHYNGVLMQQGRVQLDADWNEQVEINNYQREVHAADVIGACGVPKTKAGFAIITDPQDLSEEERADYENLGLPPLKSGDFIISRGRCYVDGILCENEETAYYSTQKDLPEITQKNMIAAEGVYLIYLDVWRRHITSLEDPKIRETALGGPDTATRSKTVWQVKARHLKQDPGPGGQPCTARIPEWVEILSRAQGRLAAQCKAGGSKTGGSGDSSDSNCRLQPQGGYGRLENQLYRIEIHNGNVEQRMAPTFKWSRDNGSVVMGIKMISGQTIEVSHTGRDSFLGLAAGQWLEILDDRNELLQKPGQLRKVVRVEEVECKVVLDQSPTPLDPSSKTGVDTNYHPRLRRWDSVGEKATENGVEITYDWQELEGEGGIQIRFSKDSDYRTGDYWTIPARAALGSEIGGIEWPLDADDKPLEQPPQGVSHHYCQLVLLSFHGGKLSAIPGADCRKLFPPLTGIAASDVSFEGKNCPLVAGATVQDALDALCQERRKGCSVTVGRGIGQYDYLDEALEGMLSKGSDLFVCLLPGDHDLSKGLKISAKQPANIKIFGSGPGTRIKLAKPWTMKNLAYVSLKDLAVLASEMEGHALTFEDCSEVRFEGCRISGVSVPVDLGVKPGATVDRLDVKGIIDNGIMLDNQTRPVLLEKNSNIKLMGDIWIKTSSASPSKYYLYKKVAKSDYYYDIRGEAATGDLTWNPQNFPGFYYDIDGDLGTEMLSTKVSEGKVLRGPDGIRYETTAQPKRFNFAQWGSYSFLVFLGDKYCTGYIKEERLPAEDQILASKSVSWNPMAKGEIRKIQMDDRSQRAFITGTSLMLQNGYSLTVASIDLAGNKVYLNLNKDGQVIDSKVISPSKEGATMADKTYIYGTRSADRTSSVMIAVHFDRVSSGTSLPAAVVDGVWQISDTPTNIKVDTEYGKMRVRAVDPAKGRIEMDIKDNSITLGKNKVIDLAGGIKIRVADSDALRYCPVKSVLGEELEVRGQVASGDFAWGPRNFAGFFYDMDENLGDEKLTAKVTEENKLFVTYETSAIAKRMKFHGWGSFMAVGFMGEEFFAGYVKDPSLPEADQIPYTASKDKDALSKGQLSKVLLDQGAERTITSAAPLGLEEGYSLAIKSIDVDGNKVYLELTKDGATLDSKVISPSISGATMADKTYIYKKDVGDCRELVTIAVRFKNAFRGADTNLATVDGIWQISESIIDVHAPVSIKGESALLNITNAKSILLSDNVLQAYAKVSLNVHDEMLAAIPELGRLSQSADKSSFVWQARQVATMLASTEEEPTRTAVFLPSNISESTISKSISSAIHRSAPLEERASAAASATAPSTMVAVSAAKSPTIVASTRETPARVSTALNLKASLARSGAKLSVQERKIYESLYTELEKPSKVSAAEIFDDLIGIYEFALRQKPGTAMIISDGSGDVVLNDNQITGLISLYGPSLGANAFSDQELASLKNCLTKGALRLGNLSGALRLRGNRLTRMNVGERLFYEIKKMLDEEAKNQDLDLDEAFHLISLTDNLFEQGLNLWIGREIRLTGNAFDQPANQKNAGMAIDGHAMFIGNSILDTQKDTKVTIINCSPRSSEKVANADLDIVDK